MSFLRSVKRWLGLDPDATTPSGGVSEAAPLFVYVKIPGNIAPLERGNLYEDPLAAALEEHGLGAVTGGGSQLGDPGPDGKRPVEFCGLDVDIYEVKAGLACLRRELRQLQAPAGTVLLYELDGHEHEESIWAS